MGETYCWSALVEAVSVESNTGKYWGARVGEIKEQENFKATYNSNFFS